MMPHTLNLAQSGPEQNSHRRKSFKRNAFGTALATGVALIGVGPAFAQFGAVAPSGPATPASPQFVAAYKQGAMVIFNTPANATKSGLGQSSDVSIAALERTAKDLDAVNVVVKANWTDATPDDQKGRVAGEVEQGIKLALGPAVATIAANLPGCSVDDPIGSIPTTFAGIFPDKGHYTVLLDKEAAAYRALEACVAPGSGAQQAVTPTTATGSRTGDRALNAVPIVGGLVKGSLKENADGKQAAAMKANQGAVATASQINVFALQAEAGAHNLRQIMKVPDDK
jgi:hypothetical protein